MHNMPIGEPHHDVSAGDGDLVSISVVVEGFGAVMMLAAVGLDQ